MKINHVLEFAVVWSLTRLIQLMPGRVADMLAAALGKLAYLVLTSRRRIARDNLKRGFGDRLQTEQIEKITKEVFVTVARASVEFARQPVLTKEKILSLVTSEGQDILNQVLKEGKGAIVTSGHFGSWELLAGWVAACGYPLDLLVGEQHNPYVDHLLISFRKSLGVGIIPVGVASRHVIKSLRSNRLVAVVSDQHAASGGAVVQFFGRPVSAPKGPAAFAIKVNCPIIAGYLLRQDYNHRHAVVFPPIYPPRTGDTDKDILAMTQAYTSLFEEAIRKYPSQWMWTHRRWKLD